MVGCPLLPCHGQAHLSTEWLLEIGFRSCRYSDNFVGTCFSELDVQLLAYSTKNLRLAGAFLCAAGFLGNPTSSKLPLRMSGYVSALLDLGLSRYLGRVLPAGLPIKLLHLLRKK